MVTSHSLQSVVKGAYLNNVDAASINCIYEHYANSTLVNLTVDKASYDVVREELKCELSEIFY